MKRCERRFLLFDMAARWTDINDVLQQMRDAAMNVYGEGRPRLTLVPMNKIEAAIRRRDQFF